MGSGVQIIKLASGGIMDPSEEIESIVDNLNQMQK